MIDMGIMLLILIAVWVVAGLLLFGGYYRPVLRALWREPMLRRPVLIFESDDWGPGKTLQAARLDQLSALLQGYRDAEGRHPVMTVGLLLAVPDTDRNKACGLSAFHRLSLADGRFEEVRRALGRGVSAGVFSLQLHGLEHYWAPALLAAAQRDEAVRAWLTGDPLPDTERLPPALQSRWIDGSQLPSRALPEAETERAAREEAQAFAALFGHPPAVLVPPTFVWSPAVERGWAAAGGRIVITPGRRYAARGKDNELIPAGPRLRNGHRGPGGLVYLVRDDYFEPCYGHRAEQGLAALSRNTDTARPTLLEMHRCNFTGDTVLAERALQELGRLLAESLRRHPDLAFLSTEALAEGMTTAQSGLLEDRFDRRVRAWLQRWRDIPRLWSFARLTGYAAVIALLRWLLTRGTGAASSLATEDGR